MKKISLLFVFSFLLINSSYAQEIKNTLSLSSEGEVCVIPNIATINLNLETKNKDISIAKNTILEESKKLNKLLQKKGVATDHIQTTNLSLRKEYRWHNSKRIFDGYKANISTKIKVTDLNKLATIYTELLDNTYININGLNYNHSDIKKLQNQAYIKALENSNQLAKQLTTTAGYENCSIISISTNGNNNYHPQPVAYRAKGAMAMMDEAVEMDSPAQVNPGQIKIIKKLQVIYEMK